MDVLLGVTVPPLHKVERDTGMNGSKSSPHLRGKLEKVIRFQYFTGKPEKPAFQ